MAGSPWLPWKTTSFAVWALAKDIEVYEYVHVFGVDGYCQCEKVTEEPRVFSMGATWRKLFLSSPA
jgi:hypothetical protein